ncbi:MAG: PIG-L family deacetylase [Acidobacteriota bacterium]
MTRAAAALLLVLCALPSVARTRAVRLPGAILWIGAHPDDEILIAPLLGRDCVERGARCSLLVLTQGEGGGSAAVRTAEMQRAAEMLHATLTLWTFSDVLTNVDATWSSEAGGREALVARIATEIAAAAPAAVYTFDPRHGSTCHPAHRALGALVIEAVARVTPAPPLFLVETTSTFSSAVAEPIVIDASAHWSYFVRDAQIHASQFPSEQIETFANLPAERRRIYLIAANDAGRAMYSFTCP